MRKIRWPGPFPGAHWYDRLEEQALVRVVRAKTPFRYYGIRKAHHVADFEALAARYYGRKYALAVNSGTGALMTAMSAFGIGPGDEVIVPAFLWVSTVGAAVAAQAIPVLCEVDDTFNMDPVDLEAKITERTRLIVVVHMAGAPADMDRIMAVANARGIPVLEDCAQCNGGHVGGRKVGTFGAMGMFSLQVNKNITAGEGGLLITDDERLYRLAASAHDVGALWIHGGPVSEPDAITWGSGRRMGELTGAVAAVQLRKLPRIVRAMNGSNRRIRAALSGVPGLAFRRLVDGKGDTGCFLILMLRTGEEARSFAERLREFGIGASRLAHYGMHIYFNIPQLVNRVPLSRAGNPWNLPANAPWVRSYAKGACPRSDALFERSLLVSVPSRLTRAQEDAAVAALRACAAPEG